MAMRDSSAYKMTMIAISACISDLQPFQVRTPFKETQKPAWIFQYPKFHWQLKRSKHVDLAWDTAVFIIWEVE